MKILVADDDLELSGLIAFALRQGGFTVVEAPDGPSALQAISNESPDLVILDVNMPRLNGFEVLAKLRAFSRVPVLMLTVLASEDDQVRGLDLGADDYLAKPFSPRTLLARVRALLRRGGSEKPGAIEAGSIKLDPLTQSVRVGEGSDVRLTGLEVRLLQQLLATPDRPVTAESLSRAIWGLRGAGDRQLLKQLVHRLRRKIEPDPAAPRYLVTVEGVGYALRV
ncbi:MAG TPA: response regulator transcription factor [Candidatus Sulfotelmatobacter sp.]|nr:response regulator transcription factor [Candidatus Sulfotelmatobacter sp.]